jgi:phage shock protein E
MGWFSRDKTDAGSTGNAAATPATDSRLIDVRSPGEYEAGHIDGALNVPLDRLTRDIARIVPDPSTPMMLYCQSGMRSGMGCQALHQLGYTRVSNGGGVGTLALQLGRPIRRGR